MQRFSVGAVICAPVLLDGGFAGEVVNGHPRKSDTLNHNGKTTHNSLSKAQVQHRETK